MSAKSIQTVLIEAVVVGVCLIGFHYVLSFALTDMIKDTFKDYTNFFILFLTGAVFHLVFEYTGINLWYSEEYCKLKQTVNF
jgi:hypothetical protein